MASRIMPDNPKVMGPETKMINFQFFPQGNSVAALPLKGDVELVTSVIRTGNAGEFTVTLADAYVKVLAITLQTQLNAFTNIDPQLGPISNAGTSTPLSFIVRTHATGVGTDIAANANNAVHVSMVLRDSGENPSA